MATLIKQITAKVYDIDNTTLHYNINQNDIMNKISFSSNINGGQGQLTLQLNLDWNNSSISVGKILKVYEADKDNKSGRLIYTGIIQRLNRVLGASTESITLEAIGLGGALSFIYYYDTSYTFNKTGEPATLIGGIITYFTTKYSGLISAGTLTSYGTNADIDFDYTTCLDGITQLKEASDQRFYIDQNGTLDFKEKSATPDHYLTVAKDIESIEFNQDIIDVVNEYILEYGAGTNTYSSTISTTLFGLRELKETKTEIGDTTSADSVGDNYIVDWRTAKNRVTITVNSNYDITTIKPGQTIKVLNSSLSINNFQIYRTTYQVDKIILELEAVNNLTQQLTTINS